MTVLEPAGVENFAQRLPGHRRDPKGRPSNSPACRSSRAGENCRANLARLAMMSGWPAITEPLLRERQGMSDEEFFEFLAGLLEAIGTRELEDAHYERAVGYPWERPPGSCLVTDEGVEDLANVDASRRKELVGKYVGESADRVPLLAYGDGSPERLALKLAHLPDGNREALILAGDLEDFDVGVAAQPPVFSSMPATLLPSPGTVVRVAVLLLTPIQFAALWWTELSYKLGALTGITLTTEFMEEPIKRVLVFISRFGAFCVDGAPVAMAAVAARKRSSTALTQAEILDAAARMSIGEGSAGPDLIKASFENPAAFMADCYPTFRAASVPFESEHWTEMPTR